MSIQRILQISLVCAGLELASGCANRSTYNPYQQYPQYPQQQYAPQPMQAYPVGQQGQIQASPQVGTPPPGFLMPNNGAPQGYFQPTGYMQPGQPNPQYYGPQQGQAPGPFIGR